MQTKVKIENLYAFERRRHQPTDSGSCFCKRKDSKFENVLDLLCSFIGNSQIIGTCTCSVLWPLAASSVPCIFLPHLENIVLCYVLLEPEYR